MSELEVLVIGFCGGCLSCAAVLLNYHHFLKQSIRKYSEMSDEIKAYMKTKNLEKDILQLKKDVNELFLDVK